ncbi:type VI secretion system protein VasD [Noviherbaspirillum humi]|uniref:Type VI secretion system protein VasD n=1 Tax=Noviherbaspirillum humi TaxID=1688639 RepID=A0A239DJ20_9BURK|nr:type VI secretion system lipoprotein TssJ [Noviherbaspirillum humi]SNS32585.1 type VI secretion system protein VasD [Noviherbaspirillum humi]
MAAFGWIRKTIGKASGLAWVTSLAALSLGGCATAPKPAAADIRASADAVINRDSQGKPLSVAIRIYQLKSATEFSRLTFDSLASNRTDAELLGADLIDRTELIMVPRSQQTTIAKLKDDTRYLGIVSLFRKPDPHYWRFLVDADKVRAAGLQFMVRDCYLMLSQPTPHPIPGQPAFTPPTCDALPRAAISKAP